MNFDISHLLESWDYQAGQVAVRRFKGKDGQEKIQLRVDLGIMQMNADGRPDGKRPFGFPSLLEFYQNRLEKFRAEHNGSDEGFFLGPEDCSRLQVEALQYHHRYICFLQLEEYDKVIRDTERNLEVLDLVDQYAESDELAWSLQMLRPQLLMMRTRAYATMALDAAEYDAALQIIEAELEALRQFYEEMVSVVPSANAKPWNKPWRKPCRPRITSGRPKFGTPCANWGGIDWGEPQKLVGFKERGRDEAEKNLRMEERWT